MDALHQATKRLEMVASHFTRSSSASLSASKIPPDRLEEVREALHVVVVPHPGDPPLDDVL